MKVEDRLIRARIQIQRQNPFFAYLSLYLKFKKDEELPDYAGAGINLKGEFSYKEEFFSKLTDAEIKGVITHEILHLSLLHLLRLKERDMKLWNIACDICVNQIIKENGFELPSGCIISGYQNDIELFGIKIEDCDKKNAEEIYDELLKEVEKQQKGKGKGKGEEEDDETGFDYHDYSKGKGKDGKGKSESGLSDKEVRALEKEWKEKVQEALTIAKMKGNVPKGIERLVGELHKEKINWKALLYQYITKQIPYNHSWAKPHKKSISINSYTPALEKEKVDITIAIDVSGSIGQQELNDFLSEIIGIARAFDDRIDMTLLTHECEVNNDYKVRNGNIEKIKAIEINGGGGTSHKEPFDYIKDKLRDTKCVVFLTDGESDLDDIKFEQYPFEKVFVISKGGTDKQLDNKRCHTINLGEL